MDSLDSFLDEVSALVHVGANEGQERGLYQQHDLHVLWVEPIPEVYAKLQSNIKCCPKQMALNYLISDTDGAEYDFHISNNSGASSSIFELALHRDIWPAVDYVNSIKLRSISIDTMMRMHDLLPGRYQALVLDTQGSELLVLKGAKLLLEAIRIVKTEAADFEAYRDARKSMI